MNTGILWACGTIDYDGIHQSPECARYVRVRISQLKRMADLVKDRSQGWDNILAAAMDGYPDSWRWRWLDRMRRLHSACLREIDRLRGGA